MSSPSLPLELLELIIDNIWDDMDTLTTCSTTTRLLLPSCRKHIFFKIKLDSPPCDPESGILFSTLLHKKFLNLLSTNPLIASYVRELEVASRFFVSTSPPLYPPTSDEEALPIALQKLLHLQSFRYHGDSFLFWSEMTSEMVAALHHVVRLPTLRRLELYLMRAIPLSFFTSLPHIENLCLGLTSLCSVTKNGHRTIENKPSQLRSLTVVAVEEETMRRLLYDPQSPFDITHLQQLILIPDEHSDKLSQLCGPSLKHLEFHPNTDGTFNLSNFTSLTTLMIFISSRTLNFDVIDTHSSRASLETLTICMDYDPDIAGDMTMPPFLSELDASIPKLTALQQVNVSVTLFGELVDRNFFTNFTKLVRSKMPNVCKRGVLNVGVFT